MYTKKSIYFNGHRQRGVARYGKERSNNVMEYRKYMRMYNENGEPSNLRLLV